MGQCSPNRRSWKRENKEKNMNVHHFGGLMATQLTGVDRRTTLNTFQSWRTKLTKLKLARPK
jgi:hypothetical protein